MSNRIDPDRERRAKEEAIRAGFALRPGSWPDPEPGCGAYLQCKGKAEQMNPLRLAWRSVLNAWPLVWRWNRQIMVVDSTATLEMIRAKARGEIVDWADRAGISEDVEQALRVLDARSQIAEHPFRERETADDDWLKVLVPLQECVAVFDENEFPPFDATGFTAKWNSVAKPVRPRGVHFGRPCLGLSFDAPDGVLRMHMTERHARWLMVSLASYLIESINRRRYQSFSSSGSPSEAESRFPGPSEP